MATSITWSSFAGLLPDGDLLNVNVELDAVDQAIVEFRLRHAEDITWWKGVLVPDGLGSSWEIWTQDDKAEDAVSLWAHQVHNGQTLEFRKAKLAGVHTGVYALGDLGLLAPGSRVTFEWAQDEHTEPAAWAKSFATNLPFREGRYWATAEQTFSATVAVSNMTDAAPWVPARRYRLGSWDPADNTRWGLSRVPLPGRVPVFGVATFEFSATAPEQPGQYPFAWRMVQDGVRWFGEVARHMVEVQPPPPPPPPPPPASGELQVSLVQQAASWFVYDGASPDPSISPQHPAPRRARLRTVRNPTKYIFYLAHLDATGRRDGPVLLRPDDVLSAPFAGAEAEGAWQAQFRGDQELAPGRLDVTVTWGVP